MRKCLSVTSLLLLVLCSCSTKKNQYGQLRFERSNFKVRPCFADIGTIDTAAFYFHTVNKTAGLKFYADGKVGSFKKVDTTDVATFDPMHAVMGYYNNCADRRSIQYMYQHVQVGKFSSNKVFSTSGDTLIVTTLESPHTYGYILKYIKKKLPAEFLKFRPDW